jgi:hypothetical protein
VKTEVLPDLAGWQLFLYFCGLSAKKQTIYLFFHYATKKSIFLGQENAFLDLRQVEFVI